MIVTINKQQLLHLKAELTRAISIVNRQKQKEIPKFLSFLNIMKKYRNMC